MIATLARLGRWILNGPKPIPSPIFCQFCARSVHVHDVHSGRCITAWCQCTKEGKL